MKWLNPRLRSWPTRVASTCSVVLAGPSSGLQVSVRSRPCTINGSPLRTESRMWSASARQAVTEYHVVSKDPNSHSRLGVAVDLGRNKPSAPDELGFGPGGLWEYESVD